MSEQYPQVRAEWREVQWNEAKRARFAELMLRLIGPDEDDNM
ncbi:hypothetical protein ACIPX0_26580 [Streptomyces sp. NPDC090075]